MANSSARKPFHSFSEHLSVTQSADYNRYRRRARSLVRERVSFERQRHFVLSLIDKDDVVHSFIDENGQVFDCVPIERQPALRKSGTGVARPPVVQGLPVSIRPPDAPTPPLRAGRKDRFGNAMQCPEGTVALRRVTLGEVTRFATLDEYVLKPTSVRRGIPAAAPGAGNAVVHPHAYGYQEVANLGGHTILSVWSPAVAGDQVFSLSQQWCLAVGPSGAQTVEAGWQVYPQMYGHSKPVLFVYWTRDSYQTGAYDYQNFVQYGSSHALGLVIDPVSVPGGAQAEIELCFLLSQGNWWLFMNGIDQQHAVGYFPTSLFAGGPMATGATRIEFGGETSGSTSFPPMGSGAYANAGAARAACQRSLHYFSPGGEMKPAVLTPAEEWPAAYTIAIDAAADADPTFYYGGPGGNAPGTV